MPKQVSKVGRALLNEQLFEILEEFNQGLLLQCPPGVKKKFKMGFCATRHPAGKLISTQGERTRAGHGFASSLCSAQVAELWVTSRHWSELDSSDVSLKRVGIPRL